MTTKTAPDSPQGNETDPAEATTPDGDPDAAEDATAPDDNQEAYPAHVVKDLRDKNAKYRTRARDAEIRADALAERLHSALVRADGRLADAEDLPFDVEHLESPEALTAAIDDLLAAHPHYAARKVAGPVGQGVTGKTASEPTWADFFSKNG